MTDTNVALPAAGEGGWAAKLNVAVLAIQAQANIAAAAVPAEAAARNAAIAEAIISGYPLASLVTQSLYVRTTPTPTGGGATLGVRALANDPNHPGRVWLLGSDFGQIGFTDDHATTWTAKGVPPGAANAGVQSLYFVNGYAWILLGPNTAAAGSLWRSPAPDSTGSGLTWTKVFDLAAPPTGITVGDQSTFRNASVAISGANVYVTEYSVATITGGPSLYYSADSGATWAKVKTWVNGKHCHAVQVISGVPWVTIGDGGFGDVGLWAATAANAMVWNRRSIFSEDFGGNTYVPINMKAMNVGGQPMIVLESDGNYGCGPLAFASQSPVVSRVLIPLHFLPIANLGTIRQLTLTAEGNLMWVQTGESGSVGPQDSVCIARGPNFSYVTVLEAVPASSNIFGTLGDAVEDGQYVWFGTSRCVKEKYIGQ